MTPEVSSSSSSNGECTSRPGSGTGPVSSPNSLSYRLSAGGGSASEIPAEIGSRCSAIGSVCSLGSRGSTLDDSISAMPHMKSASSCTRIGVGSPPTSSSSTSGRRCSAVSTRPPNTRTKASRWRSARSVSAMRPRTDASSCAISSTCAVLSRPRKTTRGASTGVCSGVAGGGPGVSIQSPSFQRSTLVILARICAPSCAISSASESQPSSTSDWPSRCLRLLRAPERLAVARLVDDAARDEEVAERLGAQVRRRRHRRAVNERDLLFDLAALQLERAGRLLLPQLEQEARRAALGQRADGRLRAR